LEGSHEAQIRPILPQKRAFWPSFGPFWPTFGGPFWPTFGPKRAQKAPFWPLDPPKTRIEPVSAYFWPKQAQNCPKRPKEGGYPLFWSFWAVLDRFGPFWPRFGPDSTCFGLEKGRFGGSGTSNRCPTPDNFRSLFRLALSVQNSCNRLLEGNPPHPPPPLF